MKLIYTLWPWNYNYQGRRKLDLFTMIHFPHSPMGRLIILHCNIIKRPNINKHWVTELCFWDYLYLVYHPEKLYVQSKHWNYTLWRWNYNYQGKRKLDLFTSFSAITISLAPTLINTGSCFWDYLYLLYHPEKLYVQSKHWNYTLWPWNYNCQELTKSDR